MHTDLLKVGHFTIDNTSNNNTMMQHLETMLIPCDIAFNTNNHRVMCFAYIVNLCSGKVIQAVSGGVVGDMDKSHLSTVNTVVSDPISLACIAVQEIGRAHV